MAATNEFTVTWVINVHADTAYEAALKIAEQCFNDSIAGGEPDTACVFDVTSPEGVQVRIDLSTDEHLTLEQLQTKYEAGATGWGNHPTYTRDDWKVEVRDNDTQCGYWEWVFNIVQSK